MSYVARLNRIVSIKKVDAGYEVRMYYHDKIYSFIETDSRYVERFEAHDAIPPRSRRGELELSLQMVLKRWAVMLIKENKLNNLKNLKQC